MTKIKLPLPPLGLIPSMPECRPPKVRCDHFFEINAPPRGYARTYIEVMRVSGKKEIYHTDKLILEHCPHCGISRKKFNRE